MAKAQDVAKLLIEIAASQSKAGSGDLMTNLRLQKLLYFVQGWSLARRGKPLFDAPLEAWQYGPVVPEVYRAYSSNGNRGIESSGDFDATALTPEECDLVLDVMREYGKYSTGMLVELSHAPGAPWSRAKQSCVIPQEQIQAYFAGKPPLESFDDILDGYPVETL